jgi:hypothetical protein
VSFRIGLQIEVVAIDRFRLPIDVKPIGKLYVDSGADGLIVVIHCGDPEAHGFSYMHDVVDAFHVNVERAIHCKEAAAACNFAIGSIGNASLDGVVEVGIGPAEKSRTKAA